MRSCLLVPVALACLLGACTPRSDVTVIKLGHGLDPSHSVHQAMVFMAQRLDARSKGTMRIDIYPSQQLGSERELLELLQLGSLGITKVAAAVLEGFAPSYKALSLPYLFRDDAHRFRVLEGPIGREILLESERYWLRGLAYYDAGSRSFYSKDRPIMSPADLSGLKVRTLESATQVQMVNMMGGSATPISWGELYTALQQGVVDAAENNPPSFFLSRHYEVCRFYTLDEHTAIPDVLLISTHVWDALSPQQQEWLEQAVEESVPYQKALWKKATEEALAAVVADGVQVLTPDKGAFADGVRPLYETFRSQPELFDLIQRIQDVR